MSAIGGKADVRELSAECLLIATSGHPALQRVDPKWGGSSGLIEVFVDTANNCKDEYRKTAQCQSFRAAELQRQSLGVNHAKFRDYDGPWRSTRIRPRNAGSGWSTIPVGMRAT